MIINHEYIISSLQELEDFAKDEFLKFLKPSSDGATLIALEGDLGSGKTAFTKAVAKSLGINEHVSSPTFTIAKFYPLDCESATEDKTEHAHIHFHELVHIDAYRMENPNEAEVLRLPEMTKDSEKLILVEWPEQLGTHLAKPNMTLRFTFIDETTRSITCVQ